MAQNHVDLPSAMAARTSVVRRRASDRPSSERGLEPHVVVATQDLPRMSGAIQALIQAGYLVTAYASPTRLLPRLHRVGSPVSLLVIDGGLTPAFARAAAIAARASYVDLPIVLLASPQAARHTEFMPAGVTVLSLPLAEADLLSIAAGLTRADHDGGWRDDPPGAA